MRRPWRSRVLPLAWFDGLRYTLTAPVSSSHRIRALLGMSLQIRQRASPNHAGPSHQRMPVASRSTLALKRRYLLKIGSRLLMAGSGYRSLGSQPPSAVRVSVITAAAHAAPNMWRLVISIACLRGLSATIAMIRFDLTVNTPANQMARAASTAHRQRMTGALP